MLLPRGIPHIVSTPNGYRLACPNGHTDLKLSNSYSYGHAFRAQICCPHCSDKNGKYLPICSIDDLDLFVQRDSNGNSTLHEKMRNDLHQYFHY